MKAVDSTTVILLKMKFSAMFSTSLLGEVVGKTDREWVIARPIRIFEAMSPQGAVNTHYVADEMWAQAEKVTISKDGVEYFRELDENVAADLKMIKQREAAHTELRARNIGIHTTSKGGLSPQVPRNS